MCASLSRTPCSSAINRAEISSISESTLNLLRFQRVQMTQERDGSDGTCFLLGLKGAVTTRQDTSGSVDVQH